MIEESIAQIVILHRNKFCVERSQIGIYGTDKILQKRSI